MVPLGGHVRNFFYLVGSNLNSSKLTPTFVEEKELGVKSPQMRLNFIIPWLYERPAWKVSCSPTSTKWKVLSHFLPSSEWSRQKQQRYYGSICFILYHFNKCLCFFSGIFIDNDSWLGHIVITVVNAQYPQFDWLKYLLKNEEPFFSFSNLPSRWKR